VSRFICGYVLKHLDKYEEARLLDHMERICLLLQEAAKPSSKGGCTILHFHQQ
jgi:hypothetical protein